MVIGELESTFATVVAVSALLAAAAGIIVLEKFFRDRLKNLFSDAAYFIFFFLVWGYFLYSVGEVAFYVTKFVFGYISPLGIFDIYWTGGAIFILTSFMGLTLMLFRNNYDPAKLTTMIVMGIILCGFTLYFVLGITSSPETTLFNYLYPLLSSLIVTFAFSVILFSVQLRGLSEALIFFFLASCSILLGDLFFSYTSTVLVYSTLHLVTDILYILGYILSFVGFITLRMKLNSVGSVPQK